jgi:hypothetical protein
LAEPKTKPTTASVDDVIAAIGDPGRRADLEVLRRIMSEASGMPAVMWGPSIIGFGTYAYRYESGRSGAAARVGFANRKGDIALYVMGRNEDRRELLARLGRHRTGKMCIYVRRLADIDLAVLRELIDCSLAHMAEAYPVDRRG